MNDKSHVVAIRYSNLPILTSALDRLRGGSAWKTFLLLEELDRLAASSESWSLEDLGRLTAILERFEKARQDPRYATIARASGFQATYEALKAFVVALQDEL